MADTRYWRCPTCGGVHSTNDGSPWLCYCKTTDRGPLEHSTPEPVAVVPLAEWEAAQRLRAALESDALVQKIWEEANFFGGRTIDAYRAALREQGWVK